MSTLSESLDLDAPATALTVAALHDRGHAINLGDRTVALVSTRGEIDWLLRSADQSGPLHTTMGIEPHLNYTRGVQLHLVCLEPATRLTGLTWANVSGGLTLRAEGVSADGAFASVTTATLLLDDATGDLSWELATVLRCEAAEPMSLACVEYNNLYPAGAGRCMLAAHQRRYSSTILVAADGTAWRFPHQHQLHYEKLIELMDFAAGSIGGFFGEPDGSPIVEVHTSDLPVDWAICDMYYDLHCRARTEGPIAPGTELRFTYGVRFLDAAQQAHLEATAQPIPVAAYLQASHLAPRFELGLNHFADPVRIDDVDDASAFRPDHPTRVWDLEVGRTRPGSLRLTGEPGAPTGWAALPPSQIEPGTSLSISGWVRTEDVVGAGARLEVQYHSWQPDVLPYPNSYGVARVLCSESVSGTSDGWVRVVVPTLEVAPEDLDHLVYIAVVLEGSGRAWITEVEVLAGPSPAA